MGERMGQAQHEGTEPAAVHEAYVDRVIAALDELGVWVTEVEIVSGPPRYAAMRIVTTAKLRTRWGAEWIRVRWRERDGWAVQVRYRGKAQPERSIYFGLTAAPPPPDIAEWTSVCLEHPEITDWREPDGFFEPQDVETALRSYVAATG